MQLTLERLSKSVRFTPHSEGRFCRGWRTKRESAKTYEFSELGVCAEKRMSFCVSPSTYRSFCGVRRKRLRLRESRRCDEIPMGRRVCRPMAVAAEEGRFGAANQFGRSEMAVGGERTRHRGSVRGSRLVRAGATLSRSGEGVGGASTKIYFSSKPISSSCSLPTSWPFRSSEPSTNQNLSSSVP